MLKEGYAEQPIYRLRHSTAHLMAHAVMQLFPGTRFGVGPPIDNGFYYDFELPTPLTEEDIPRIEERMHELAEQDLPIERFELTRDEARKYIEEKHGGDPYKLELLDDIPEGEPISFFRQGEFADLCRGPHLESTGEIKHFKLLSIAGAYWRGSEWNKMLTRLYGTAWFTEEELQAYLQRVEEAKLRDHKRLGKELGLFMVSPDVGSGLPMLLPKGATIRQLLEEYIHGVERRYGYLHVVTPAIAKLSLYERSGHLSHYKDSMYPIMDLDGEDFVLRPMNCPHHFMIYKAGVRSYRDLPMRIGEHGTVYRYERSGVLSGLMRVRCFTINDAHCFITPEQIKDEVAHHVSMLQEVYDRLGIPRDMYWLRMSVSDRHDREKYHGDAETWDRAEAALRQAMDDLGTEYTEVPGEAAFYGPKIDVELQDALGREESASTIQLDFFMPERFDLEYIGEDGRAHRPVVIHRAPIGSFERMIAYLIELYGGAFPLWLAPVQVGIVPIADRHLEYAQQARGKLEELGFRVEVDGRRETVGYKIRDSQKQKLPYTLVVGDKEVEAGSVSVRVRAEGDIGGMSLDDFVSRMRSELP
jgi:threonyl-tRNA synthetase